MKPVPNRNLRRCALATLLSLLSVSQPFAQGPGQGVARLKQVNGNVLVSRESGLAAGDESLRVVEGTRIITTANSEVTVVYDNGCEVKLMENQRFEVKVDKLCAALIAQVEPILIAPAETTVAGFLLGGAGASAATLPALGVGMVGLAAIIDRRGNRAVSPN